MTITEEEFEKYLVSIGGLVNGIYTKGSPIVTNICECGSGWLGLIKDLIQELVDIGWNKEIRQIKEKFGGLRFYAGGITEEMDKVITKYEILASKTCEVCGTTESVDIRRKDGWISTLCDKDFNKEK